MYLSLHFFLRLSLNLRLMSIFLLAMIELKKYFSHERGKAGGHEPPLFPLPCHILAFFSSGSHEPPLFPLLYHHIGLFRAKYFLNGIFRAFKVWFYKIQPRHSKKHNSNHFSTLLKITVLFVEFLNCFTKKFLKNLTEYCILKYHKVG